MESTPGDESELKGSEPYHLNRKPILNLTFLKKVYPTKN